MKLPLNVARALVALLTEKDIPSSAIKNKIIAKELEEDGILKRNAIGRTQGKFTLISPDNLHSYLKNKYQISDLELYIQFLEKEIVTAKEGVQAGSDSKLRNPRNLKGFVANCNAPIKGFMGDEPTLIIPQKGFLTYVHDYEIFRIESDALIVSVENPENIVNLNSSSTLFPSQKVFFVSRYPQSNDLVKWLKQTNNQYLHFGDFDLKGIAIYLDEFKKHLGNRGAFFIPPNIQEIIRKHGSRKLYDQQLNTAINLSTLENSAQKLVDIIHQERKGIEQQYFL